MIIFRDPHKTTVLKDPVHHSSIFGQNSLGLTGTLKLSQTELSIGCDTDTSFT